MGFDLSGFVLRAPRTATANALTTDEAVGGVSRDFKPVPEGYYFTGAEAPDLVDVAAEQYRAATLRRTLDGSTEYLLWAANTSNVWVREGLAKDISNPESVEAAGSKASVVLGGSESVFDDNDGEPVLREDGSLRFSVREPSGQSVASVSSVTIRRGDSDEEISFTSGDVNFNAVSGVVTLDNPAKIGQPILGAGTLAGGISKLRGDSIREITVTLAATRFWWSKNDRYETRFQWNGGSERWEPLKGTAPRNLGRLLPDGEYILSPNPNVAIGEFLPGNSADPDDYSMIRLGVRPDASSVPVAEPVAASGFGGLKVVTDGEVEAEDGFDFANLAPDAAGVVAATTGQIQWNPAFLDEYAGQVIWYSYRSFLTDNTVEPLGSLEGTDVEPLFLAPIPAATDYPFIRIGNRNPLEAILVDTDALLFIRTIEEGQVGISLSTGRMKFSDTDIAKADPEDPTFDPAFLGSVVFYDGLSLTQVPLEMRAPIRLVNSNGNPADVSSDKDQNLYVPDAAPLPAPGISGVQFIPDKTGGIPDPAIAPSIRANGSNLVREVRGDWDLILFSDDGRVFRNVTVVADPDDEIPRFAFQIDKGRAYLDLNEGAGGSKVTIGRDDRKRFTGQKLWFRQTSVQPAMYAKQARMFSRVRDSFDLVGDEVFKFGVNGDTFLWRAADDNGGISTSDGGSFTPAEIVTSLSAVAPAGAIALRSGRVVLQSPDVINGLHQGSIEIGFGEDDTVDLSGPSALGFLPGWRVAVSFPGETTDTHWMPDNGSHLGVFRSPLNLDGTKDIADIQHRGSIDDVALTENIPVNPVVLLDKTPIEDEPGYDDGVFFRLEAGLSQKNLEHYDDVLHQFGEGKFTWISRDTTFSIIEQAVMDLALDQQQAVPNSFRLPSNGLFVSETGGPMVEQTLNTDFLLPFGGAPGTARLIETIGKRVAIGARGFFSSGSSTFTDDSPDVDFVVLGVTKGHQLKITTGEGVGTYIVTADATDPKKLEVEPPFAVTDSTVSWELFFGVDKDTNDLAIVASEIFTEFNHLQDEPFKIRVLSTLGDLPATAADQAANRFEAVLGDALANGRPINIRFGLPNASPTATLVRLTQSFLGTIVNSALEVPNPASERFANEAFSIKLGTKTYTFADGNLVKVPGVLTLGLAGDVIEVQDGSGLLNFGAEVFAQFPGTEVYYVEEFNDPDTSPTELPEGTAEYRISDGALNFSAADMAQYGGMAVYLVEQMITEAGLDVSLNPIGGSFLFTKPLREQQVVEVEYFQAEQGTGDLVLVPPDDDVLVLQGQGAPAGVPVKVIEFLPLFTRLEDATKPVIPPDSIVPASFPRTWLFNPTERTVRSDIEPQVFVNNNLCNAGGSASPICTFDYENGKILFEESQPDDAVVQITYAVQESFGGEASYTVSTPPVYRPPFFIEDETDKFTLEGDRTGDVFAGKLLRVGPSPFYIVDSTFDGENTEVEFFPKTETEAGSRAPGNDTLTLLSDRAIAKQYNADAGDGFWRTLDIAYEPINRGFQAVTFLGNLTALAIAGTLLEIGGYPFIVAGNSLSEDGTKTVVDLTTPSPTGFFAAQDEARLSVRPVYPPSPTMFLGVGAILPEDEVEAVLFGETDESGDLLPGRTLRLTLDYALDFDTGTIEFLSPTQAPLRSGQTLYLRRTQVGVLAPIIADEVVINPRFLARYAHAIAPSNDNGILGETLRASYTFAAPDAFFYRSVPLVDYMAEIAGEISSDIAAQLPSNGATPAIAPAIKNYTQGGLGLKAQLEDLRDQDRAARVFIEFYNGTVLAFEQVLETISGDIIGDRDGKFKFFIGRDKDIPPPGYEDAITGRLNTRNIFSELFFAYNRNLIFLTRDALVEPDTATLDGDRIVGKFIDPDFLSDLSDQQREFVQNDIDDLVLVKRTRKRLRLNPFRLEAFGRYRTLGEPSRFSRLFPQRSQAFMLTDPGIEADLESDPIDPGVYAFRKKISRLSFKGGIQLPKRASTFRKTIADISNPVLGTMEGISRVALRERLPRARVFAYSETGFPDLDADLVAAGFDSFTASPRPAVIATVLPLHQFPIRDDGLPDLEQLIANGGGLPDLSTGDPDLFTPEFITTDPDNGRYPMVAFGRPTGQIIDVAVTDTLNVGFLTFSSKVFRKVFVNEVMLGCVITFGKDDATRIESASEIIEVGEEPDEGEPLTLERGDTVFVTPPDVDLEADDPPDNEDTAVAATGIPGYRIGFDVKVDTNDGELVENTWPSFTDPSIFGLKEIFGQKPPKPLDHLEAIVSFRNTLVEPAPIPALTGGPLNDSGDYTLPYLVAGNTEIDRLGEVTKAFDALLALDTPVPSAVYPDEILGNDGLILADLDVTTPPGALLTAQDATPVATNAGVYVEHSGIGDVGQFDFLLVERGQPGLLADATGILSVGAVEGDASGSVIEPPRFVSPSSVGTRIRYTFNNVISFVNQLPSANPPGMVISRFGTDTIFDCTSISPAFLVFNDGSPPPSPTGGLNDIIDAAAIGLAYPGSTNVIRIHLWTADDGVTPPTFLQTVEIDINAGAPVEVTGNAGTVSPAGISASEIEFDQQVLTIDSPAFVSIGGAPGDIPEDPTNLGFSVPLWFTIDVDVSDVGAGSGTGYIDTDRLSFVESYDLRSVRSRDEPDVDTRNVSGDLEVFTISGPGSSDITVNGATEVNGGLAFTWKDRSAVFPFTGGEFDFTGEGRIKVMAFEGHGNVALASTQPVVFSAIPSSPQDEIGVITAGEGSCEGGLTDFDNRIAVDDTDIDPGVAGSGAVLGRIQPGDIAVITASNLPALVGTSKAGTYLVKHAVAPDSGANYGSYTILSKTLPLNSTAGAIQFRFPTLVSLDTFAGKLVLDTTLLSDGTPAWRLPIAADTRIWFIPDPTDIRTVVSVEYTAHNALTGEFTIDLGTIEDISGGLASFPDSIVPGITVSGFARAEIRFDRAGLGLPRNLVGYRNDPAAPAFPDAAFGFGKVTIGNPTSQDVAGVDTPLQPGIGPSVLTRAASLVNEAAAPTDTPAIPEILIAEGTPIANTSFDSDPDALVYESVAAVFIFALDATEWTKVHGEIPFPGGASGPGVRCLYPSDTVEVEFRAQAGVFLEPSVPRPVLDLASGGPKVVDAGNSLVASQIGMRDGGFFGVSLAPNGTEKVRFEVRRIRRFHKAMDNIGDLLAPLRYAYEIRTGVVDSFGPQNLPPQNQPWPYVIEAAGGTQLGPFDDDDVNVNPGDFFRLLDANGKLIDEVEIGAVVDGDRLALKAPGILAVTPANAAGLSFEIYLRKPPVPHAQSNEQLLDLLTDEVLVERSADYAAQTGGWAPIQATPLDPRKLKDTDNAINFAAAGVQEGDIVIIDPAGEVRGPTGLPATGQERGIRPFGDRSVPNRILAQPGQEVPFIAGAPSELDDNRGWYRVTEADSVSVTVNGENTFAGPGASPVTFGDEAEYAVLPTISNSTAPFADPGGGPGVEGQNDLRPTGFAGEYGSAGDSYQGNLFSIAPFGYRIIRPSALFSDEAVDLICFMRERTLSFIEEFDVLLQGRKHGSYFVFQRDQHIADLGNPLIPDEGLGVMSNALIRGVAGETQISPFANTSDSLAVLDRRFWVNDFRLDGETPSFQAGVPTYATLENNSGNPAASEGDGRPVLPDLITGVLDNNDQFRPLRLSWIDYRVNREDGKAPEIERTAARLPKERSKQRRALRQSKALEDT